MPMRRAIAHFKNKASQRLNNRENKMQNTKLDPELERRIASLEMVQNQGAGFGASDWLWLLALGVIGPVLILMWGWSS
jgi:hypothetical protein